MEAPPRLLVVMGSGETSPTMVKTHRAVFDRFGPPPVPAVVLDTPFGFQENAAELSARAIEYFRKSVGRDLTVASFLSADASPFDYETMLARLREASYVFAGPGSPSYALRQWKDTQVPELLAHKLRSGGAIVFASAAALTLGLLTIPVYEIYKVGEDVRWLPGLNLLAEAGLSAAVVPHYDNAEGGTHDTRYCYMGERRLRLLEEQLPEETFVLGVDEHTACLIDLAAGTASVTGRGGLTVRRRGRSTSFPGGETFTLEALRSAARNGAKNGMASAHEEDAQAGAPGAVEAASVGEGGSAFLLGREGPLLEEVKGLEVGFDRALAAGDARSAAAAILELDSTLEAWAHETFSSDEMDRARGVLRSMVVRLAERAVQGLRDPQELVGPYIEAMLRARGELRAARLWTLADELRDELIALGVEVRDTAAETQWRVGRADQEASEPSR